MLNQLAKPAMFMFCSTLPLYLLTRYLVITARKRKHKFLQIQPEFIYFLCYIYIASVLLITVVPLETTSSDNEKDAQINLVPLYKSIQGVAKALTKDDGPEVNHYLENIVGNIILFMPLGLFIPLVSKRNYSTRQILILSAACSIGIELTQLLSSQFGVYRWVDIDDVIFNTIGGVTGFIVYKKMGFLHSLSNNKTDA